MSRRSEVWRKAFEEIDSVDCRAAAEELAAEVERVAAEAEAALLESLAIHAPPCPDWFQPVPAGGFSTPHERNEYRHAHWPWHHAEMVLAARPGGAK